MVKLARTDDEGSDVWVEAAVWDSLGYAHYLLSHHTEAIACYQRSFDKAHQIRDTNHEADVLLRLGDAHQAAGDPDAARRAWQQALAIIDDLHRPDAGQARARLLKPPPPGPPAAPPESRLAR